MPTNLFHINWIEVLQGDFLFRLPRDFVVASTVHVKFTEEGKTVKYEPSWSSQKHIREKKVFHSCSLQQFSLRIMKIQHGDVRDRSIRVRNPCELCFTITNSLSPYLQVNCFSLSSLFSAPLVDITLSLHCTLLCFIPFQSYSIYCMVSNRSKILISVYIIQFFCWQKDNFVNFLWLIS